jgi:hypothetical protein
VVIAAPFRILTMSIFHLTGVAFVGSFIFTLSTFASARQARVGSQAFRDPAYHTVR